MIISHKHKYLFVELPHTASTAISEELCENYDGVPILHKHARYHQFLRVATPEERTYFVFSCVRNPLDVEVSKYFKFKTGHQMAWRNIPLYKLMRYRFVQRKKADFLAYARTFHVLPYDRWSSLAHKDFDFVMRYEHLHDDFAQVLSLLGLEQKRPLPMVNRTPEKEQDFHSYYTPEIRARAKRVFGPYMKEWGYEFPPEWGDTSVSWSSQMLFEILGFLRWRILPYAGRLLNFLRTVGGRKEFVTGGTNPTQRRSA